MEEHGKFALVTGAASGIGRDTVAYLAARGWRVAALDRQAPAPAEGVLPLVADVSDESAVRTAVAWALDWGGDLDLLVNNAGTSNPVSGPVADLALADWNAWIGTNLTGPFLMAKHCVPALRRAKGAIVNIASTRAIQSEPDCEAYGASKGGLLALTHALAVSLGPDIRVNAVAPGWIDTAGDALRTADHDQHPAGRVGQGADVASAVHWLAGQGFVTGQTIVVDGGMTVKMIYRE